MTISTPLDRWTRSVFDSRLPLMRQIPVAVIFVLIWLLNLIDPDVVVDNSRDVHISTVIVLVATLGAALLSRRPDAWRYGYAIAAADLVAIGILLMTAPVGTSAYVVLLVLPVLWLAGGPGRRYVVYAIAGVILVSLSPLIIGRPIATSLGEALRAVFAVGIFSLLAVIINELSRLARLRAEAQRQLATRQEVAIAEGLEYARRLSESEDRLVLANARFREVWEAVTEQAVVGSDLDGVIDAWNRGARRMLQYRVEEADGFMPVAAIFEQDELARRTAMVPDRTSLQMLTAAADSGFPVEWTLTAKDGTTIPVEMTVTTRRTLDGTVSGYLFVAHDVSRMKEIIRLKDEFIGLVSHELRTPLSSILGYLELLRDENGDPEAVDERVRYLDVIERNGQRLMRLVNDLLATAQVDAGLDSLDVIDVDLAELAQESIESLRPRCVEKDIAVVDALTGSAIVSADVIRLGQAIDNLLTNAVKFTWAGGTITVGLETAGSEARLSITDTGMGIPPEEIDQLFDKFFRASTATDAAIQGIGLGLHIVDGVVRAHHGHVEATSVVGVGSTFTIVLPLVGD